MFRAGENLTDNQKEGQVGHLQCEEGPSGPRVSPNIFAGLGVNVCKCLTQL